MLVYLAQFLGKKNVCTDHWIFTYLLYWWELYFWDTLNNPRTKETQHFGEVWRQVVEVKAEES